MIEDRDIAAVRRFNRAYTRHVGALEEHLLDSPFSLTEARILYELAQRAGLTASDLAAETALDAGYLSRTLKRLREAGLIARETSREDGRRELLALTADGQAAFAPLDAASDAQVRGVLDRLEEAERRALLDAMATILRLIEPSEPPGGNPSGETVLREPRPGDIGWIIHRQARLYHAEYGWDWTFEALLAEISAAFIRNFDPTFERCFVAERDGAIVGAAFVVRDSDTVAKLRMVYVEPDARGAGIGQQLVEAALAFARVAGYARMTLWTNDVLTAAARLYRRTGFALVREEHHHAFGKDLVGQYYERDL